MDQDANIKVSQDNSKWIIGQLEIKLEREPSGFDGSENHAYKVSNWGHVYTLTVFSEGREKNM